MPLHSANSKRRQTRAGDAAERARVAESFRHDVRDPCQALGIGLRTLALRLSEPELAPLIEASEQAQRQIAHLVERMPERLASERSVPPQDIASFRHDFRNPQQALGIALRTLKLRVSEAELGFVESCEHAHRQIGILVDQMLDILFLWKSSRAPRLLQQGVALDPLLADLRTALEQPAISHGVSLRIRTSRVFVISDRTALFRILYNLVANALEHARATRVLVGVRVRGEDAVIEVRDNGRGIASQELPFIFDMGFRGSDKRGPERTGHGMGLYIVKEFSEGIGGAIRVVSQIGRGTTFRLTLPGPIDFLAHRHASRCGGKPLFRKLVAIVDDDNETIESLRPALENLGATVISSMHQIELLRELAESDRMPDLFILGVMTGHASVHELLALLDSRYGSDKVRTVIVTGFPAHPAIRRLTRRAPILQKPLTDAAFASILDLLCDNSTTSRSAFDAPAPPPAAVA
jgi:signal transduction histidine kinase/CheY-like chemotaxis protein